MSELYNVFIVFTDGSTYRSTQPMKVEDSDGSILCFSSEDKEIKMFPWRNIKSAELDIVKLS